MIPYLARLLNIMMNNSVIPEALRISYQMWQEQIISVLNVIDRQNIYSMDHTATLCWVGDKGLTGKL
jgi:putative lipase involved disintegration of autophagic bodies